MARANSQVTGMREALENATAALVRLQYIQRVVALRVTQARQRTGLHDLLSPALNDLDDISRSAQTAQAQVGAALSQLLAGASGSTND